MVERARLEIVLRRNTYGGSNPSLCAMMRTPKGVLFPWRRERVKRNPTVRASAATLFAYAQNPSLRQKKGRKNNTINLRPYFYCFFHYNCINLFGKSISIFYAHLLCNKKYQWVHFLDNIRELLYSFLH